MKRILLTLTLVMLVSGCTRLKVKQTDQRAVDQITTTEVTGTAWFSSAQHITKLKALQTEKTQSFGTDTIGQQGATNSVAALQAVAHILELLRPAP